VNLKYLYCGGNFLTDLDIYNNINLIIISCSNNLLTSLDFSNNQSTQGIYAYMNLITDIDVSQNSNLEILNCFGNQITNLDITQNQNLWSLRCNQNQLTILNIQNGNNTSLINLYAQDNPDLTCIQVDDVAYSNTQTTWYKDEWAHYSEYCDIGIDELIADGFNMYPNPVFDGLFIINSNNMILYKVEIINALGVNVSLISGSPTQISFRELEPGMYFVRVFTNRGVGSKKIIKI